jgi:hypothetical protein
MSEELFYLYPRLWSLLNMILLKKVLYDSESQQLQDDSNVDLKKVIKVAFDRQLFKWSYIQGAEQIKFEIFFEGETRPLGLDLRVTLETERVQNAESNSSVVCDITDDDVTPVVNSKGNVLGFENKMQFYNMMDKHSDIQKSELDGLVYSHVTVQLLIEEFPTKIFGFKIKNYNEMVRYKMTVKRDAVKLKVVVEDADFEEK